MESDEELVLRVRRSDHQAASELVRRYENTVFATALGILREHHSAEDVTQDSFLAAFRNLHSLWCGNRFGAWLLSIAKREAIRTAKSRNRRDTLKAFDEIMDIARTDEVWEKSPDQWEIAVHVAKLPEHERLVVYWFSGTLGVDELLEGS